MKTIRFKILVPALATSVVFAGSASAATITQTVFNQDWNNNVWGSPASAPTSGNDYVSASGILRIDAPTTGTAFGGDNLTIVSGTRALIKTQGATATVTGNITMNGGTMDHGPDAAGAPHVATLAATNFIISSTSTIALNDNTSGLTIDATLTGAGSLFLAHRATTLTNSINFTGVLAFTGAITIGDAHSGAFSPIDTWNEGLTVGFGGSDYAFSNTFTLLNGSVLKVNTGQTLTFDEGDLIEGSTAIGAGTYTGTELGTSFSLGSGSSIVVIPEPSTAFLGVLGFLALVRRRRC